MQKQVTQPLLSGNEKEPKKQQSTSTQTVSHPVSTVQSSQTSQSSAAVNERSRRVDEALERQRAITGKLDEQIADVKAKISQHQLQQLGTVATRPSTLRWNLVPDEYIISPRRSRHSGLSVKLSRTKRSRSPSRQTIPLLGIVSSGPAATFDVPATTFSHPTTNVASCDAVQEPSPTSGQSLPPFTNTQSQNVQGPDISVPDTTEALTGVAGPLTTSTQVHAMPTLDAQNCQACTDSGTSPGFLEPQTPGQILPPSTTESCSCLSSTAMKCTGAVTPVTSSGDARRTV